MDWLLRWKRLHLFWFEVRFGKRANSGSSAADRFSGQGELFFPIFSTKNFLRKHLVFFGAHDLVQVPNLKIGRFPVIFLLKSRFSFTLPLGLLLALTKGNLKEV